MHLINFFDFKAFKSAKLPIPWKSIFTSKCVYAFFMCQITDVWYQVSVPALIPSYMVMALKYNILEV